MNERTLQQELEQLDRWQSSCTNCGLCAEGCATFQASGWEQESPRGRIALAAQLLHGHIPPQSEALTTFDRCLSCRACESLCPHQVPYQKIRQTVQDLRGRLKLYPSQTPLTHEMYQQWIKRAQRLSHVGWRRYGWRWLSLPLVDTCSLKGGYPKEKQETKNAPLLVTCCLHDLLQQEVITQTLAFMKRLGYPLRVDALQPCCGALFERLVQAGGEEINYVKEHQKAKYLQEKRTKKFLKWLPAQAYFVTKGCQCFVSRQTAQTSFPVLDLYEHIEKILEQNQGVLSFTKPRIVYYQPYCQGSNVKSDGIKRLLKRIQGLTVIDLPVPLACCGGFGGEALLHPTHAKKIGAIKLTDLPLEATLIVTSPDCWAQFRLHAESHRLTLLYPIQLLEQAIFFKPLA